MAVLGRQDSGSALSDTTSTVEARRFDATRARNRVDLHGLTHDERRAALSLASGARNGGELAEFLAMCGLLPGSSNLAHADMPG